MNRNNFWRFVIVVLVLIWAVFSFYPPTSRDLIQTFRERAVRPDTNFHAIVESAIDLQRKIPEKPYENLKEAIGTNDITRYFPFFEATNADNATLAILNRLQRESAGKIHLGINSSDAPVKFIAALVVEKGKPPSSPVPEQAK